MGVPIRLRHNEDINLTSTVTDELHSNVGVVEFKLSELPDQDADGSLTFGYDMFCDMVINDGAGGSGTELVVDVDYLLLEPLPNDHELVQAIFISTGLNKTVYTKLQIISASFQTGDLYFSYTGVADDNSAEDLNNLTTIVIECATDTVQANNTGFRSYDYTCGTSTKTHTAPDAALNKNLEIEISKGDTGYGPVLVVTAGGTINGLSFVFLWSQYDTIRLRSDGTNYKIINGFQPYYYSGWINRAKWATAHIGFATIVYDALTGTVQIGDKVTGANGSYGIVIYDNGSTSCVIASCVTVGATVFANDEALTFDLSGATASVNMASGLKDVDSNIYHGWGKNNYKIFDSFAISTDGTEANSWKIDKFTEYDGSFRYGHVIRGVDNNSFQYQTAVGGLIVLQADGSALVIDNENYFYNELIKLIA